MSAPGPPPSPLLFTPEFRAALSVYRGRVAFLLQRDAAAAKQHVRAALAEVPGMPAAVTLRARLQLARGKPRKAARTLTGLGPAAGSCAGAPVLYYNDLALVHLHMRKPRAALFYAARALRENHALDHGPFSQGQQGQQAQQAAARASAGACRRLEAAYTAGLAALQAGNGELAFACFQDALPGFANHPRAWLRIAESVLVAQAARSRPQLQREAIGAGATRKQAVWLGAAEVSEPPAGRFEYAARCLRNVLALSASPALPPAEAALLRSHALLSFSYLHLHLQNPVAALMYARQLLQNPPAPSATADGPSASAASASATTTISSGTPSWYGALAFHAHLYAAEALCYLGHVGDAAAHLSPGTLLPLLGHAAGPQEPLRAALYANLASVHLMREPEPDFAQAQQALAQAQQALPPASVFSPPSATASVIAALQLYLEMRRGNHETALELVRKGRPLATRPPLARSGSLPKSIASSSPPPPDRGGK